jgi:hypothetical protein
MISTRRILRITATALAAVVIALLASRSTEAIIIINNKVASFGYVGLAAGQMARINVFNHADPQSDAQCLAGLRIFNDANKVLAESNAALRPGASRRLNYTAARAQKVRAIVAAAGPDGDATCSASFEIVEQQTGRTVIFVNTADLMEVGQYQIADWGVVRFD